MLLIHLIEDAFETLGFRPTPKNHIALPSVTTQFDNLKKEKENRSNNTRNNLSHKHCYHSLDSVNIDQEPNINTKTNHINTQPGMNNNNFT